MSADDVWAGIIEAVTANNTLTEATLKYLSPEDLQELPPQLEHFLAQIPLSQLDAQYSEELLLKLLKVCHENGNAEALRQVLTCWRDANPQQELLPVESWLFRQTGLSVDFLKFLASSLPYRDFTGYLLGLKGFPQDEHIDLACRNLLLVFGPQEQSLYASLRPKVNFRIRSHLEGWMADQFQVYAPLPEWVKPVSGDPIPTHQQLLDGIETRITEADVDALRVGQLLEGLPGESDSTGPSYDPQRPLPLITRRILRSILEARLGQDEELFRIAGPCHLGNLQGWLDSRSDDPCLRYGGHRMLLCVCQANIDEDGEPLFEDLELVVWFTGRCDFCNRLIRELHHALRLPVTSGGWRGCYCSPDCLIKEADQDFATRDLALRYVGLLQTIGIYDRRHPRGGTAASSS